MSPNIQTSSIYIPSVHTVIEVLLVLVALLVHGRDPHSVPPVRLLLLHPVPEEALGSLARRYPCLWCEEDVFPQMVLSLRRTVVGELVLLEVREEVG